MTDKTLRTISRRRLLGLVGVAAGGLALGGTTVLADDERGNGEPRPGSAGYRVTVANLTGGQPLTPPLLAVHRPQTGLFSVGDPASEPLKEIAENGNLGPMIDALEDDRRVSAFVVGDGPLVPAADPGDTGFPHVATYGVRASRSAKYLSYVSMLIATNDGFAGLDTVRLPDAVGESTTYYAAGFDAGTETNTEDFVDIVPPAQALIGVTSDDPGTGTSNPALAENGVVHHHAGVAGGEDLRPDVHGWRDPVVMVHVERVA